MSALVAAVLMASLAVSAVPVTTSGGTTADAGPSSFAHEQPTFRQPRYSEHRGDVATVGLDVGNRTEVTLHVTPDGFAASGDLATVVVHDRDGDGAVDVRLDTYALGREGGAISATGSDTVDVRRSSHRDEPLTAGNYSLTLERDGETVDASVLVVRPASIEALRAWTARDDGVQNLSTRSAIEAAIRNGTLVRDHLVSTRDVLVIEVRAAGLAGPLASQPGSNATARFLNLLRTDGFSLRVAENASSVGVEQARIALSPRPGATTVVAAPEADTYYVVSRVGRLRMHAVDGSHGVELENGDLFDLNVTLTEASDVVDHGRSVESRLQFVGWAAVDTPVTVAPTGDQTVAGRSNFGWGTHLTVVLESENGSFEANRTVKVGGSGRFAAAFDLSNLTAGSTLTLTVRSRYGGRAAFSERDAVRVRAPSTATRNATPTTSPTVGSPSDSPSTTPGESGRPGGTATTAPGFGRTASLLAVGLLLVRLARGRA